MNVYETDRLIVRHWETEDFDDLYDYASNDETVKFLSFPVYKEKETAKQRIQDVRAHYETNEYPIDYAIELKEENKVIGSIGIVRYKEKNEGEVEIGYILNKEYNGNGYMTEALIGMFRYIKEQGIAKRIVLKHDVLNFKSGNVMKRAGMSFEGVLRRAGTNNYHSRADLAIYSILFEEIE